MTIPNKLEDIAEMSRLLGWGLPLFSAYLKEESNNIADIFTVAQAKLLCYSAVVEFGKKCDEWLESRAAAI